MYKIRRAARRRFRQDTTRVSADQWQNQSIVLYNAHRTGTDAGFYDRSKMLIDQIRV